MKLNTTEVVDVDATGYIEPDTNIGAEVLNLFYSAQGLLTDTKLSFLKEVAEIAMKEIDATWIRDSAYMISGDFAYILNRIETPAITAYFLKTPDRWFEK